MQERVGAGVIVLGLCLSIVACGGGAGDTASTGHPTSSSAGSGGSSATSTTAAAGTGGAGGASSSAATSSSSGMPDACTLQDNTTETATASASGCHLLDRDTSACQAARAAQGLSGLWLKFSCRVTLTVSGGTVKAAADGQPDYKSNYFAASDPCHEVYTGAIQNPNDILPKSYVVEFPEAPSMSSQAMMGGIVGLAINGVPIFDNAAGPGDDIYQEAKTFDRCGGHPQMTGGYHYHSEPYAISNDDAALIGVLRDGYPVYGRQDKDGTTPTVDAYGGHTGTTVDSPSTPVYHYHLNQQTSANPQSTGQMQWFLTTGTYRGAPAACGSCN